MQYFFVVLMALLLVFLVTIELTWSCLLQSQHQIFVYSNYNIFSYYFSPSQVFLILVIVRSVLCLYVCFWAATLRICCKVFLIFSILSVCLEFQVISLNFWKKLSLFPRRVIYTPIYILSKKALWFLRFCILLGY